MLLESEPMSVEEATADSPSKLDQVYAKLAFFPEDLEKTYAEREKQLTDSEKEEERLAYFETLLSHEQNLKDNISKIKQDIESLEQAGDSERYHYSMMPHQHNEFMDTFKKEYGVDNPDDLLTQGTVRDIYKYDTFKLPLKVVEKIKNHGAMFYSKKELGLFNTTVGIINKRTIERANFMLEDKNEQLKNIQKKLEQFELK